MAPGDEAEEDRMLPGRFVRGDLAGVWSRQSWA
jgi:hypothetical protein